MQLFGNLLSFMLFYALELACQCLECLLIFRDIGRCNGDRLRSVTRVGIWTEPVAVNLLSTIRDKRRHRVCERNSHWFTQRLYFFQHHEPIYVWYSGAKEGAIRMPDN